MSGKAPRKQKIGVGSYGASTGNPEVCEPGQV